MCGIFGVFDRTASMSISAIAKIVSLKLAHRGPDDFGGLFTVGDDVQKNKTFHPTQKTSLLMLHYRLSILDLSDLGWQPMSCPQNRFHIVFNGEIYNYQELRDELILAGYQFRSQSDTEVLLTAYIKWGKDCLHKLEGMFAFAIYDSARSILFVARDAFGIKPLYYSENETQFIFGSEIKALLSMSVPKTIHIPRVYYYLRSGLTDFGGDTLFAHVKQLPAGHYLELDLSSRQISQPQCYFVLRPRLTSDISYGEAVEHLRHLFLHNIRLHLRSDVKIGAALSGGIDSSAIVMAMRHLYPTLDINTFSYVAQGTAVNEEKWIDIVNVKASAYSHKVNASENELVNDLQQLINIHDEPFGSTSIYAQHLIFRCAKEHGVKVMLDGQGADELLAGYTFYRSARLASLVKSKKFMHALTFLYKAKDYGRAEIVLRSMQYLLPLQLQAILRPLLHKEYMPAWLNKRYFETNHYSIQPVNSRYGSNVLRDDLVRTLECTSLPMLLRYEDRNSMSYSIESRVPFLTSKLAQFVVSLPEKYLIDDRGTTKAVFRDAMRGIVPDPILNRKDKIGFATPEINWIKTLEPWVSSLLNSDYAKQLPVFNHAQLIRDWNSVMNNKTKFDFRIWRWINFIKWSEQQDIRYG